MLFALADIDDVIWLLLFTLINPFTFLTNVGIELSPFLIIVFIVEIDADILLVSTLLALIDDVYWVTDVTLIFPSIFNPISGLVNKLFCAIVLANSLA